MCIVIHNICGCVCVCANFVYSMRNILIFVSETNSAFAYWFLLSRIYNPPKCNLFLFYFLHFILCCLNLITKSTSALLWFWKVCTYMFAFAHFHFIVEGQHFVVICSFDLELKHVFILKNFEEIIKTYLIIFNLVDNANTAKNCGSSWCVFRNEYLIRNKYFVKGFQF